jgi:LPXTG-motif cell wall-anchored protein
VSNAIGSTKTISRFLSGIFGGGVVLAASLFAAAPASAAATCTGSAAARTCTDVYTYTGAEQDFHVPAGVTTVATLVVGGAGGYIQSNDPGGEGASVTQSLTVHAGETLVVEVGGVGANHAPAQDSVGGFNGGGTAIGYFASNFDLTGAGGGGASDVRTVPSASVGSLGSRLVVAAGGGGGGEGSSGGDAGSAGSISQYLSAGEAGTAVGGGAGGPGGLNGGTAGNPGTLGIGGDGDNTGGAGGGGGLYGGGGAGTYGGGGGGSSLGTVTGVTADPASVSFTFSAPDPATPGTGPRLPTTGTDPTPALATGLAAILAGLVVLFVRRRRAAN